MSDKLKFGYGNAKLPKYIATFSIPSGYTCKGAKDCLAFANKITGKITDGKDSIFRCFSASQEALFPSVRINRWRNFELLKKCNSVNDYINLIQSSLMKGYFHYRWHVAGDWFSENYFIAVMTVAKNNPDIIFYGYTKMLNYLVKYKNQIPSNFRFTASKGGLMDSLIVKHKLRFAEVVYSVKEAEEKNLEIDHDDSHAMQGKKSFALLIHGTQPAGSMAAKKNYNLQQQGLNGYFNGKPATMSYAQKPKNHIISVDMRKILSKIKI